MLLLINYYIVTYRNYYTEQYSVVIIFYCYKYKFYIYLDIGTSSKNYWIISIFGISMANIIIIKYPIY